MEQRNRHRRRTRREGYASLPGAGSRPGRTFRPELGSARLERRDLTALYDFHAAVVPEVLRPTNGGSVPVFVTGSFRATDANAPARPNFQVVDQYRIDQPSGYVTARAVPGNHGLFTFAFRTYLDTSVSKNSSNGRFYTMVVAVTEGSDSVGRTFPLWVPQPGYKGPLPVPHPGQAVLKLRHGRLPGTSGGTGSTGFSLKGL